MTLINLNADLGESFGPYKMGEDETLLTSITSANVACAYHGGDPVVMHQTIKLAKKNNVSIGAHPSFPDLQGFGRRPMTLSPHEVYTMVIYQIGALQAMAASLGETVTHVKPHGALNNMACEDADLAHTLCKAVKDIDSGLIFLAPALSQLSKEGKKAGLCVAEEIFADRAYTDKGTLVNRKIKGAVIHDKTECTNRVLDMIDQGGIVTLNGQLLKTDIHSICVHGDTISACETAEHLKHGLLKQGLDIKRLDEMDL